MKLDVDSLVKPEYDLSAKAEEAFVTITQFSWKGSQREESSTARS